MFYSMVAYKLKVMHVEDATLIFSPIRKNTISYPSEDKKISGDSSMVLTYDGLLCGNVISKINISA